MSTLSNNTNLFQSNLTKSQVSVQNKLKENIAFCQKLVNDLSQTFNVVVENKRNTEDSFSIKVYPPQQAGRFGYALTFKASDKGVIFLDDHGVRPHVLSRILKMKKETENKDEIILAGKKKDIVVSICDKTGCGKFASIETTLKPNEAKLNEKLKIIIGTMMGQGIHTKLNCL